MTPGLLPDSSLRAGSASADITPTALAGLNAMGEDFLGVHDRLAANAVVLASGDARAAVVSVDLLELGVTAELRNRIALTLGIPADAVLLVATHSHNAPRAGRTPPGGLSRAASPESLAYTDRLFEQVLGVIAAAQLAMRPARIGHGRGAVDVNVNRDELRDGRWVLGSNVDGPSEKTVEVIAVQALDGSTVATLVNYAVHPTAALGSRMVSADIAGATARRISALVGGVSLWLPGAIGDQAPRADFEQLAVDGAPVDLQRVFELVDSQGASVADEAVRVLRHIDGWTSDAFLGAAERTLDWPAKPGVDLPPDMHQDRLDVVGVRLITLTIGDIAILGVGGEVTTPAAAQILAACRSSSEATLLVSIVNERLGYLADREAFALGTFAARGCPIQVGWESEAARELHEMVVETRGPR